MIFLQGIYIFIIYYKLLRIIISYIFINFIIMFYNLFFKWEGVYVFILN